MALGKFKAFAAALPVVLFTASSMGATHTYHFRMNGSQEVPPVVTSATGLCTATLDDVANQVSVSCTYSGLTSNANNAHIHAGAPGVSGGPIVPLTFTAATSGTATATNASISASNVAAMIAGNTYVNVHSVNNGGGEIRGQIVADVPAVSTWGMIAIAILLITSGTIIVRRKAALVTN